MVKLHPFGGYNVNEGMKFASIINLALISIQGLVDISAVLTIKQNPDNIIVYPDKTEHGLNFSAICGIITLLIHIIICIVHLLGGYTLYRAVAERNYVKCHQWYIKFVTFLTLETVDVLLFLILAPTIAFFIAMAIISLIFKWYLLWPMSVFIEDIRGYAEPFASEAELHL